MRTLLIGSDFMYNSNGQLVPIEINTNVGMNAFPIEDENEIFNFDAFTQFIISNNFTKISYIGSLELFNIKLKEICATHGINHEYIPIFQGISVPDLEDTSDRLIIRSSYDYSAIVDTEYCGNKINFLNLIKNQAFGSQFAYINEDGLLINNITTIPDNGNNPNFILKATYPQYDEQVFPKFFKITNQDELNVILQNVTIDYFLMPFYYNPNKLFNDHIVVIRSFNLLFPPDLASISIGQYRRITTRCIDNTSTYNPITFELDFEHRTKYITGESIIQRPKLIDTDMVEMADGTFKTAVDLQVDDIVKTIDIPNPYNVDITNMTVNYRIDYETFISGTTYSQNRVIGKARVDKFVRYVTIYFTDNTTWSDTINSSYLVLRNDEVRFVFLNIDDKVNGVKIGDDIIQIDTSSPQLTTVLKRVESVETVKLVFGGWEIAVEEERLFLTRTEDITGATSFVSIEHNAQPCTASGTYPCTQMSCSKGYICCPDVSYSTSPAYCWPTCAQECGAAP